MLESTGVPQSLRFRQAAAGLRAKIELITQKAHDNPTWTRKELIAWAAQEFRVKETTARGYVYQAAKLLNKEQSPNKDTAPPVQ